MNTVIEQSTPVITNQPTRQRSLFLPLLVLVAAAIIYPLWWKTAPLKAEDTAGYQAVAQDLVQHGWFTKMHFRCPGYPLVLALTGSSETLTRSLFFVTLAMYLASVWMLIAIVRQLELPAWSALVVCLLGISPPFVEPSAYAMTEGLTTFLLVGAAWALIVMKRPVLSGVVAGVLIALAAFARPTYQVLGLVLAGWLLCFHETKKAVWLGVVSSAIIGAFCLFNWVKFDYFAITPALGWNLCTKTAGYIERAPKSPLRDQLVERRNKSLVEGASHSGSQYIYGFEHDVARVTGLDGVPLAKYMLAYNKKLILGSPLYYLVSVGAALTGYWLPALGMICNANSRLLQGVWTLMHFGLMAAFFLQLLAIVGTALTTGLAQMPARLKFVYWMAVIMIFYTMALTCLLDVGNPRCRVPTDGLLVVATLIGFEMWKRIRAARLAD
jgi:hypothetical protein